jgi:hypothetical protein
MTLTTPASGVLQTLDVLLHLTAKRTFHDVVGVDLARDAGDLVVGQVLGSSIGINPDLLEYDLRRGWTDPMDVLQ